MLRVVFYYNGFWTNQRRIQSRSSVLQSSSHGWQVKRPYLPMTAIVATTTLMILTRARTTIVMTFLRGLHGYKCRKEAKKEILVPRKTDPYHQLPRILLVRVMNLLS